jgi:hypothetical protein
MAETYTPMVGIWTGPRGVVVDTPCLPQRRSGIVPGGPTTLLTGVSGMGILVHSVLIDASSVAGTITLLDNGVVVLVFNVPLGITTNLFYGPIDVLFLTNLQETVATSTVSYTIMTRQK